jgi:hypothetical protein
MATTTNTTVTKPPNLARKILPQPDGKNIEPDGRTYLSRKQFAKIVGVSHWKLQNYAQAGIFLPFALGKQGRGKAAIYHVSQVDQFRGLDLVAPHELQHASIYTSEQAQKAFQMLDAQRPMRELVTVLGLHPHVAEALLYAYSSLEQGMVFTSNHLTRINILTQLDGFFPLKTPDALVEVLEKAAERIDMLEERLSERMACASCKRVEASYCKGCVATTIEAVTKDSFDKGFSTAIEKARAAIETAEPAPADPQNTTGASAGGVAKAPEGPDHPERPAKSKKRD